MARFYIKTFKFVVYPTEKREIWFRISGMSNIEPISIDHCKAADEKVEDTRLMRQDLT